MLRIAFFCMASSLVVLTAACSSNPVSAQLSMPLSDKQAGCSDVGTLPQKASVDEVLNSCGEPSFRDPWGMVAEAPQANVIAPVEEWYYNPGPNGDVQVLRFVDGRLVAETGDGTGFDARRETIACDDGTVSRGLSKYRLVQACGEPLSRETYVVDPHVKRPGSVTFSQGNALVEGDKSSGLVAVYREDLSFQIDGKVKNVTVQNGRVLKVVEKDNQLSSAN